MGHWKRDPDSTYGRRAADLLDLIDAERARRSLPGAMVAFLERFPEGFSDAAYLREERSDKVAASALAQGALTQAAFAAAETGDPLPLLQAVKGIVNATNLIQGSFEKPKLFDAMLDPANAKTFVHALGALLHGAGEPPARLEAFSDYLHTLGLRKWTYGTYFLFLAAPEQCFFVKPESLKKAAEKAVFNLDYESAPTAIGYARILEFANWIRARLLRENSEALAPRDMIDIQSFIWFVAPTGKFAKD